MTSIVAVADPARGQGRFVAGLSSAFAAAGFSLQSRTHSELAAEVSIEQMLGEGPIVEPDRPLLWFSPGHQAHPDTADNRFLAVETLAAARSIATLTRSPVLNRPSPVSLCGAVPPGPALAVRRSRLHDREAAIRAERFTGSWMPDDDTEGRPLEVYDYASGRSSYGPAPDSTGPFRRRAVVDPTKLVAVRVVGDRTITEKVATPAVLAASLRIASGYLLDMATVWWLLGEDGVCTLARIDCWPWDAGFSSNLEEVAEAVVAWISDRMGQQPS